MPGQSDTKRAGSLAPQDLCKAGKLAGIRQTEAGARLHTMGDVWQQWEAGNPGVVVHLGRFSRLNGFG